MDKNEIMIKYLSQCPYIKDNDTFFNFAKASDNNKQFITQSIDRNTNKSFVDGTSEKIYSITITDFKSIGFNAIIDGNESMDENISEMLEVQNIMDWIKEQERIKNYPDFGEYAEIEEISCTRNNPQVEGIDTSTNPALAIYSITINVTYLDSSEVIWN